MSNALKTFARWVQERRMELIEHHPGLAQTDLSAWVGRDVQQDCLVFGQTLEQDVSYNVLDVVIIEEGLGKNFVFLPPPVNKALPEYFAGQILEQLQGILEGYPIEYYEDPTGNDGENLTHPSAEYSQKTPMGNVSKEVGFLRKLWVETVQTGQSIKRRLRGQAVLNESSLAQHLRDVIRSRIEHHAKYVPAPSINGQMLWTVEQQQQPNGAPRHVLAAQKVLSMRSVELVSRPAAGGTIYAVMEALRNMKTYVELLKAYCAMKGIGYNAEAQDAATLLASIEAKDDVLTGLQSVSEAEAMAALSQMLDAPQAEAQEQKAAEVKVAEAKKTQKASVIAGSAYLPGKEAPIGDQAPRKDTVQSVSDPALSKDEKQSAGDALALGMQVMEQVNRMQNVSEKNAQQIDRLASVVEGLTNVVSKQTSVEKTKALIARVQESAKELLPEQMTPWLDAINKGTMTDLSTLDAQLKIQTTANKAYRRQVQESLKGLPVAPGVLAFDSLEMGLDEYKKPLIAAKMLFHVANESEKKQARDSGLKGYRSLPDMYAHLCPADDSFSGVPYGGRGKQYQDWYDRVYSHPVIEGTTTDGHTVTFAADFANVFLAVVGEIGMAKWGVMDKSFLDLCSTGLDFTNFIDANIIISGAAPDMEEWTEEGGYPELDGGDKVAVTLSTTEYGGIMRWSHRIVMNNQLNIIQNDVNAQIEATWRVFGKAIVNLLMGWTATGINTRTWADGAVYYSDARRNLNNGDGRLYSSLVATQNLMLSQRDIAKAGQTPEMMGLRPGVIACVNTAWASINGMYKMATQPGNTSMPNELGLPNPPKIVPLHQGFLHDRVDFVGMLPDPASTPVIEVSYLNGQRDPAIVWQEQPSEGRCFTHGELAARFSLPLRFAMLRPYGSFVSYQQ